MDHEALSASDQPPWMASVIVPAHNEESVIGPCLAALSAHPSAPHLQVVVVANGCRDRTADVARGFGDVLPGLTVIEREQPGKIGALNAGDVVATAHPRIYLDADIVLETEAVTGLITALGGGGVLVASPRVRFDTRGASVAVRAWYRVFERLPYASSGLVGLGVYGLSRQGRSRFEEFPQVTGDDLFVQRLFAAHESATTDGQFVVRTPRRLADLVAVRTRVAQGNAELASLDLVPDRSRTTTSTSRALVGLLFHRPLMLLDVLVYVVVTGWARRAVRSTHETWHRDDSSRAVAET